MGEKIPAIVAVIAFAFHIIGFVTPWWYQFETRETNNNPASFRNGYIVHIGLWHFCRKYISTECTEDYCRSYSDKDMDIPLKAQSAQAFESIALVLYFMAIIFAVLKAFIFTERQGLLVLAAINSFAAAFFGIIGVILFGTICSFKEVYEYSPRELHKFKSSNFHFAFAFCIIAVLSGIAAGIMFAIVGRKTVPVTSAYQPSNKTTELETPKEKPSNKPTESENPKEKPSNKPTESENSKERSGTEKSNES